MKTKWLWLLVPVIITIAIVGVFLTSSGGSGTVSARLVSCTLDLSGQAHTIYEITNGTSTALDLRSSTLQTRNDLTGWWEAIGYSTGWHFNEAPLATIAREVTFSRDGPKVTNNYAKVILQSRSAIHFEIIAPRYGRGGSSVRGKLWYIKKESQIVLKLRSLASGFGVPSRWLMWPKPGLLELAEAKFPVPVVPANGRRLAPANSSTSEEIFPVGCIKFRETMLRNVLNLYADLSGVRLEIDAPVRTLNRNITLENTQPMTRSALLRLIEENLREQAGIRIEPSVQANCMRVILDEKPSTR